ncbi:MAG: hypothetical protein EAZ92_13655 [Candidatus Kapaibacterium sp.]|nr:MAG: hypothetical protein EAZ92_13655 [Candidatus Kapabacteria bacterium]
MEDFLNNMGNPEQQKGLYATFFGLCMMAVYIWWMLYFFRVLNERLKKRVESRFAAKIDDSNEGMWDVTGKIPWYKSLALQLLQIPLLVLAVMLPFAVLITIWFAVVKFFWK